MRARAQNARTFPAKQPDFTGPPPEAAALHIAVDKGDAECVALLLAAGADANLQARSAVFAPRTHSGPTLAARCEGRRGVWGRGPRWLGTGR